MTDEFRKSADSLLQKTEVVLLQADFMDEDSVSDMIAQIKETGILPNQIVHLPAPKAIIERFRKEKWRNFEDGINVSLRSAFMITHEFITPMEKAGYGRIVFMLTSYTLNTPPKFQASYVTVKYALLGLMKTLSVEYADKGITVNGVSPDMMDTKFISEVMDTIVRQNRDSSPLKRNVRVEEVIPIILYMLSDEGAAMTGENIGITGGVIRH